MKFICRHWPILLLALWFGCMSVLLDRSVALFSERTTPDPDNIATAAPWRSSRLFVDPDSYAWLSYARDLRESPHFRVRYTHMDNAPYGRPVHWAQLPIWLLCGIANAFEAVGVPSPSSLELAGRVLLPLLGFLSFSALWLFLRRRVSYLPAALVTLSSAIVLSWHFHPLHPDHHGFHLVAAAAFILPLLFSSFGFAAPSRSARLPFLLSGIFGGVALWLGATVFYFTLATAAVAAAITILPRPVSPPAPHASTFAAPADSTVWRLWGLAGALSSLFFWVLEYAPNHFSMRLEANHPLYALSFLGIGECLYLLMRFRHQNLPFAPASLFHATLALSAAAVLPVIVLFGPVTWYIPRSTLMLRLHARHIMEFLSLRAYCEQNSFPFLRALLVPILPALPVLVLVRAPFPRRILFTIPFFFVFLSLYLWQNRWEPFAAVATYIFVLAFYTSRLETTESVEDSSHRSLLARLCHALPCLLLAGQLAFEGWHNTNALADWLQGKNIHPVYLLLFQYNAIATQFRPALSDPAVTPTPNAGDPRVLAPANFAPLLWYHARIPAVASLYWENLSGNAAAAEAFADPLPDAPTAAAIVAERSISHVFMLEGPQNALLFDDLHTGIHTHPHAARTLAGTLAGAIPDVPLPPWLAVDTDLNRLANPTLYTYIPPEDLYSPNRLYLRIYSLMP